MPTVFRRSIFCFFLGLVSSALAAPPPSTEPALGTYHWPNGQAGVDAFAAWLGRPSVWGLDFIGGESWDNVAYPTWWLESWGKWVNAKPGRRLVLSVPVLAGPPDGTGPKQGSKGLGEPVSLEKGAHGDYNAYFHDLAENLVRYQLAETILRPAWEFNGGWYAWHAKGQAGAFAGYWRQIVKTMRAVPGTENIKFCWNPTLGEQDFPAEQAWPGYEYVDFVGLDVYDETWNADTYPWPATATAVEIEARHRKVWSEWIMNSSRGLAFWAKFASDHHRPLAIPEWGVNRADHGHGGLDNPYFIEQMHAFFQDPANHVAFHCYFDVNAPDGRHQLSPGVPGTGHQEGTEFPQSAAKFRELFGASPKK